MRYVWLFVCAVFAAALQQPALAAEEVLYEPAAAWVQSIDVGHGKASENDGSIRTLLEDVQVRFGANGVENFYQTAWQVLTAEGLDEAGEVSRSWDPLTETLTIHAVEIIRDGKAINVLNEGPSFTIIRQEPNLSYAVIDGRLTATLQIEDLRVGDVVRFASTRTEKDPTLGDHIEYWDTLYHSGVIDRVRYRQVWPKGRDVRWRTTEGFAKPVMSQTALGVELISDAKAVRMPIAPSAAPDRFDTLGEIELTSFKSWRELSALFAPYYAQAIVMKDQSPLRAEAEKIRAAHASRAAQASAALALVEQRVRYVALTMGVAGYQPANVDLTWSRRFGDCKGKSALLIALLTELGIPAEAAIVQTSTNDGLESRLPRAGLFDHVIVRVEIDGKTYWLDPTRSSDTDIGKLSVPSYRWALPLRAGGADLEALNQTQPTEPLSETIMAVDARGGLTESAPVILTMVSRGEEALSQARKLNSVSRADAERNAREGAAREMPWLTVEKITIGYQVEKDGSLRQVIEGKVKTPWQTPSGSYAQELTFADTVFEDSFKKRPSDAMPTDAPFSLNFPYFTRSTVTVQLPRDGKGFELVGADVNQTVAGMNVRRVSTIKDGLATMTLDIQTVALETPYAEAMAAEAKLKALPSGKAVILRAPRDFSLTKSEVEAVVESRPKDAQAYVARAQIYAQTYQTTAALADLDQALTLEPENTDALIQKVALLVEQGDTGQALKLLEPMIADEKMVGVGRLLRSQILQTQEQYADALIELDQAVTLQPNVPQFLAARARLHAEMKNRALALKDINDALRSAPGDLGLQRTKIWIEHGDENRLQPWREAMIAFLTARIDAEPKASFYAERAGLLASSRKRDLAKADYDKAIELEPTAGHYLARASFFSGVQNDEAALADFAKALALDPSGENYRTRARFHTVRRDFAAARKDLDEAAKADRDSPLTELQLAALDVMSGQASAGFARADKLVQRDPASRGLAQQQLSLHMLGKAYDLAAADARALANRRGGPIEKRQTTQILATILGEQGEGAESVKLFNQLVAEDPKNPSMLNGRCWSRAVSGLQLPMAKADCEAALALSSPEDQAPYLDSLGLVYLRLDRSADAVAAYDKALSLYGRMPTSLYGRGLAKARLGDPAAAEKDKAAALALDPDVGTRFAGFGVDR